MCTVFAFIRLFPHVLQCKRKMINLINEFAKELNRRKNKIVVGFPIVAIVLDRNKTHDIHLYI